MKVAEQCFFQGSGRLDSREATIMKCVEWIYGGTSVKRRDVTGK
jgi:hypothetical protein